MSVRTEATVLCDGSVCCTRSDVYRIPYYYIGRTGEEVRRRLSAKGWRVNDRGKDYCPACRAGKRASR